MEMSKEARYVPTSRSTMIKVGIAIAVVVLIIVIIIAIAVPLSLAKTNVNVPAVSSNYQYALNVQGSVANGGLSTAATSTNLNNDGFDDLLLGSPNVAAVYVVFGRSYSFSSLTANLNVQGDAQTITFLGGPGDQTGAGVASGDVNGDGYIDAIFSAPNAGNNGQGAVYVVYGSSNFSSASQTFSIANFFNSSSSSSGFVVYGPSPYAQTGVNLYAADLNNDGFDDLIIGCANATLDGVNFNGVTYVVWGSRYNPAVINLATASARQATAFVGASNGDMFGTAVAAPGDLNGDGIQDFVATSPGYLGFAGAAYVIYGSATKYPHARISVRSLSSSMGYAIIGRTNDEFGEDASYLGDFNNDGLADFIVAAPGYSSSLPGSAVIIFGTKKTIAGPVMVAQLDGTNGVVFDGARAGDEFGDAVSSAGDYNLDGVSDAMIGAPFAGSNGAVYILFGQKGNFAPHISINSLSSTSGVLFPAPQSATNIGEEVWGGFDFNGDGRPEAAIPLPLEPANGASGAGVVTVLFDLTP